MQEEFSVTIENEFLGVEVLLLVKGARLPADDHLIVDSVTLVDEDGEVLGSGDNLLWHLFQGQPSEELLTLVEEAL